MTMESDKMNDTQHRQSITVERPSANGNSIMGDASEKETQASATECREQQPATKAPPNGGYGWVCSVCVCIINAHTWGINSSYGVFLAYYLRNNTFPGATSLEYAFVGSLSITCSLMTSPIVTVGVRKFGTKPTMFFGVVVQAASLIGASFATEIWHLFLTQGIFFGIGMGFLFNASVGIIPQWFTTRRSLANGISASGSGLGGVVYSFATGAMIQNVGLGWAFRILGILAIVVNSICVLLVKDRNKAVGARQVAFDTALLKRAEYLALVAWAWFSVMGYVVLVFSLANYGNDIGLTASQAALISALFNLGQGIGRPMMGYFSDRTGRINMAAFTTLLAGVFSLAIWINTKTYGVLVFFAILSGTVGGTLWAVVAPVTAEVVGLQNVPSGLTIMWMMILLPCAFSEPIALQIVAGTGSYLGTQLFTGLTFIAAAALLVVVRGWKIAEVDELARAPETEDRDEAGRRSRQVGRHRMLADFYKWRKV